MTFLHSVPVLRTKGRPRRSPMASIPGITTACVIPRPGSVTTITTVGRRVDWAPIGTVTY